MPGFLLKGVKKHLFAVEDKSVGVVCPSSSGRLPADIHDRNPRVLFWSLAPGAEFEAPSGHVISVSATSAASQKGQGAVNFLKPEQSLLDCSPLVDAIY